MDPHAAWLISQGMKTLHIRLKEQNQSALTIAGYLQSHPNIQWIQYPFLASSSQYFLAQQILQGGGGVISFSIKGGKEAAIRLLESVRTIGLYVSLGGVHSCIEHAQSMSHSMVTQEHKNAFQSPQEPELIRLSIGLENVHDLIADLTFGLKSSTLEKNSLNHVHE